jgi:hypothetical protein
MFAVLIGVGLAGNAWAVEPTVAAVGPSVFSAVQTQKAVGPLRGSAVQTQKAVGPRIYAAVQTQKAVGPRVYSAVRTQKAVGASSQVQSQGTAESKTSGQPARLDLNAGF